MSEGTVNTTRRGLLRAIGASAALTASPLPPVLAQHVHEAEGTAPALAGGADYQPKALTAHEFATLGRLSDLIVPADDRSPGASAGGAAEFIDFLCSRSDEMKHIYTGGLAWLDNYTRGQYGEAFVDARPEQQTAVLDRIAYRKNAKEAGLAPGVQFFTWVRAMVVDAFYTSPAGIKDLGYEGNTALAEFHVPEEAIEYALKRSPFAGG